MFHPLNDPARRSKRSGFTLIELLIVVAIIAILAAIAVPNFLEAQTRAKVSRTFSDMRTMRTALESYVVDNNRYPETDRGILPAAQGRLSFLRLTTPISYLTSIPSSPWRENYGTDNPANPKLASELVSYLYVRRLNDQGTGNDADWNTDVNVYLIGPAPIAPAARAGIQNSAGEWLLKSVGPDNVDNRQLPPPPGFDAAFFGTGARLYDPTNGTVSFGDIVVFSSGRGSLR